MKTPRLRSLVVFALVALGGCGSPNRLTGSLSEVYSLAFDSVQLSRLDTFLLVEYAHAEGWVHFEIPKWLSLGLIVVIFAVSYVMARRQGPVEDEEPTGA